MGLNLKEILDNVSYPEIFLFSFSTTILSSESEIANKPNDFT
uniref:RpoB, OrsajCp015 n=1 Tax=Arundo donax TaxID=35708 RepID=A0A0A9FPA1_ARUDO